MINWHGLNVNPGADPPSPQRVRILLYEEGRSDKVAQSPSSPHNLQCRTGRFKRRPPWRELREADRHRRGVDVFDSAKLSGAQCARFSRIKESDVRRKPMNTCPPIFRHIGGVCRGINWCHNYWLVEWFVCQEVIVVGVCVCRAQPVDVMSRSKCTMPLVRLTNSNVRLIAVDFRLTLGWIYSKWLK